MKTQFPSIILVSQLIVSGITYATDSHVIEPVLQKIPIGDQANLASFYMGQYEVTVAEFMQFVNETGYQLPSKCMTFTDELWPDPDKPTKWNLPALIENPYRPIVCVGAQGALDYADWLSKKTGKAYKLPSERQWRHAALAGQTGRMAFADDYDQTEICKYENTEDIANIAGLKKHHQVRYKRSAQCNDGAIYHTVVGMYRPNQFGLYDMMGNVREYTRTCHAYSDSEPKACKQYVAVGEAWHWQPRGVMIPDWIEVDFQGSIEGFRLVLEAENTGPMTKQTLSFLEKLKDAHHQARQGHAQLQRIPATPEGVFLQSMGNKTPKISWLPVKSKKVKYTVYRALSDFKGAQVTRFTKIVDELNIPEFIDTSVPKDAFARYQVFSYNDMGEGLGSKVVTHGEPKTFTMAERIEAEHHFNERYTWISKRDAATVVGFSSNPDHFPTGIKPHKPAWLSLALDVTEAVSTELTFRAKSGQGGGFELWQGTHLVGRYKVPAGDEFSVYKGPATIIKSNAPLEIRAEQSNWFELDWLEFKLH